MRILCCGDREWTDEKVIYEWLTGAISAAFALDQGPVVVIEGECRGADRLCRKVAEELDLDVWKFPADWQRHGKAAGPIRNQQMLKKKPDQVFAFHPDITKSKGTSDMVKRAMAAGVMTSVIGADGKAYGGTWGC